MAELALFVNLAIGLLMIAAAGPKIAAPGRFRNAVLGYRLLPHTLIPSVVVAVPAAETAIGALALAGWHVRLALWAAVVILCGFALAMTLVVVSGRRPDCGCGLSSQTPVSARLIARNLVLAALCALAADNPAAGLRDVVAGSGRFASGGGIAILIAVLLVALGSRLAATGAGMVRGLSVSRSEP